jgi:hypothetical protein
VRSPQAAAPPRPEDHGAEYLRASRAGPIAEGGHRALQRSTAGQLERLFFVLVVPADVLSQAMDHGRLAQKRSHLRNVFAAVAGSQRSPQLEELRGSTASVSCGLVGKGGQMHKAIVIGESDTRQISH